ncbi:hypothetical protein KAFR_0A08520 [Kazachstania africana CBS 2517]|uniref:Major facilitator superfamily (MFS) profile domain-containing protein n=1 Tax=Kazachstania africana (strain ATCC 22294 / BCRC 22015 / CBS 2517 / CECT 1963 / NBRC 1671 / NRRL Y-8276) TaxID=1071382 RepID=H2API6_KAZAF|nr:hypothetical protein KAFR_0A08520 [Kazachstania africana CBS 2517]CCF56286.1 hypothetical protein KAFR_0A08520 [Kazachstania africana CBS 2517]
MSSVDSSNQEHKYNDTKNLGELNGDNQIKEVVPHEQGQLDEENLFHILDLDADQVGEADLGQIIQHSPGLSDTYNINSEQEQKKPTLLIPALICLVISFGGFIFGWDVGTIGGVVNMEEFRETFGTRYDILTDRKYLPTLQLGLMISIVNIGAMFGGLLLPKLGVSRGRKLGILISTMIYMAGILAQLINCDAWFQFFVGRAICGMGIGSLTVLVPMFISEIAPLQIRGSMVALYQLMITFGILVGNLTNYAVIRNVKYNGDEWKIPIGLGILWASILLLGLNMVPESAPFLIIKRADIEGAKESFAKMNNISPNAHMVAEFVEQMSTEAFKNNELLKQKKEIPFEFINGKPRLGLRLLIGIMIMVFQQLSGINYFFYYSTSLFANIGIQDSYITSLILSTVNFFTTFGGIILVERWGRKMCLLVGSVGMFFCMIIYASVGSFVSSNIKSGVIMIVVTCIYIMFFAATTGPVSFVLVSELFPMRTKAISMAICNSMNWMVNFVISMFTPAITSKIGFKYGYVFAGCLLASIVFVITLVPETKNKNEQEIDKIYERVTNSNK